MFAPLVVLVALSGAAEAAGDFGRAERNFLTQDLMPAIGEKRAWIAGETISSFNLTDQETEMRDRIWRYLVAPHAYDWFGDVMVELQRTRIIPISRETAPPDRYYKWLHETRFASSRVRYSRVNEDVIADLGMMPDAFRAICAVIEVDRQRGLAVTEIAGLEAEMRVNVSARRDENQALIDWFVRAVTHRYASYSYALDHLLVETPHEEAIGLNGSLSDLAVWVDAAQAGDFCSGIGGGHDGGAVTIRSRVLRTTPDEGPYRK